MPTSRSPRTHSVHKPREWKPSWPVLAVALCLVAITSRAQQRDIVAWDLHGLVVTDLRASRPAVLGRFATVEGSIRNRGKAAIIVKDLKVTVLGPDGSETPFAVTQSDLSPEGALQPGHTVTFRQFQRMNTPGDCTCAVSATETDNRMARLSFADGRPAVIALHVVPETSVPRVELQVEDARSDHVYAPGDTIQVKVLPVFARGADLTPEVSDVTVSTPARPFSMDDPAAARAILLGNAGHPKTIGFRADFFGLAEANRYLDITIRFEKPVEISTWALAGTDLNGEYGLKECAAEAIRPQGDRTVLPSIRTQTGAVWTVTSSLREGITATGLRLRVATRYKINVTSLTLQGNPVAGNRQPITAEVTCRWQSASGGYLSAPSRLRLFQNNVVTSPPNLSPGYYGLAITTRITGADDARGEYGFAVLDPGSALAGFSPPTDPRLGMVHMDVHEKRLGVAWLKTLDTAFYNADTATLDTGAWQHAIAERRDAGFSELPLLSDSDWATDSTRPVTQEQLNRLQAKMAQYFQATPDVHFWELGLEENLGYRGNRDRWIYYWPNLEAKARALHQAAVSVHADVRFIYQIAELDLQTAEEFCKSSAYGQFDVLSLHPYAWPDFPPPDKWMPDYLGHIRSAMEAAGAVKPIWFTEIGAPHNGNPGGFFGYPDSRTFDRGLDREEHAAYTVKCNVLAFALGVDKVFWYTYRDGGANPEYAEDHFGLIDYRGYPKPVYVAYSFMARLLNGKPFQSRSVVDRDIQVARFRGARQDCVVVWTYPAARRSVTVEALQIAPARVADVRDLFGKKQDRMHSILEVGGAPVYLLVNHS